jgi:hypothetical protein
VRLIERLCGFVMHLRSEPDRPPQRRPRVQQDGRGPAGVQRREVGELSTYGW